MKTVAAAVTAAATPAAPSAAPTAAAPGRLGTLVHRRALDGAPPPLLMQRTCGGSLGQALSTGRQPQHSRCSDMLQHALLRRFTACLCCCFRTGRAGVLRRVMSQVMRQGMRQAKGRKVPSLTSRNDRFAAPTADGIGGRGGVYIHTSWSLQHVHAAYLMTC